MLRIVTYPHPALRYESRPVTQIDDRLRANVRAMFELMYASKGIGLAANQVAIPQRFFVLNLAADAEQKDQEQVFINPEVVKRHSSDEAEEGCLSFPGLYFKVKRPRKVKVRAYDYLSGNEVTVDADDLHGRALQHETDHVFGRLYIDLLDPALQAGINGKIVEIEKDFREQQARGEYPDDDEIAKKSLDSPGPSTGPRPEGRSGMRERLRLVMLGTGDFAVPTFGRLCESPHEVVALVTQPDKPQGRKGEILTSLIKRAALDRGVRVEQPESINAPEGLALVRELAPDLLVTAAYGQILSADVLSIPRLGGINLHGSILPRYPACGRHAPEAIQNGEAETGVTVIRMTPRVDAGGMISFATTPIGPDETAGEVEDRLAAMGAPLIVEAVEALILDTATIID